MSRELVRSLAQCHLLDDMYTVTPQTNALLTRETVNKTSAPMFSRVD